MNKKGLNNFVSLKDLPLPEEIIGSRSFLNVYRKILLKNKENARELMARHLGRKPMTVKKRLKSIIKEYNFRCCWNSGKKILLDPLGGNNIIKIKDIKELEEKLLDNSLGY